MFYLHAIFQTDGSDCRKATLKVFTRSDFEIGETSDPLNRMPLQP